MKVLLVLFMMIFASFPFVTVAQENPVPPPDTLYNWTESNLSFSYPQGWNITADNNPGKLYLNDPSEPGIQIGIKDDYFEDVENIANGCKPDVIFMQLTRFTTPHGYEGFLCNTQSGKDNILTYAVFYTDDPYQFIWVAVIVPASKVERYDAVIRSILDTLSASGESAQQTVVTSEAQPTTQPADVTPVPPTEFSSSRLPIAPDTVSFITGIGRPMQTFTDGYAFSEDGKYLATNSKANRTVSIFDTITGEIATSVNYKDITQSYLELLGFSADGQRVAMFSLDEILITDLQTNQTKQLPVQDLTYKAIASPDLDLVAYQTRNRQLRVINTSDGSLFGLVDFGYEVSSDLAIFNADGRYLALTSVLDTSAKSSKTELLIWDTQTKTTAFRQVVSGLTRRIAFSPDGKTFVAINDGEIFLWKSADNTLESIVREENPDGARILPVSAITFTPDSTKLFFSGKRSEIYTYDLITGEKSVFVEEAHDNSAVGLGINRSSTVLISIRSNSFSPPAFNPIRELYVRFWDIQTGKLLKDFVIDEGIGTYGTPGTVIFGGQDMKAFLVLFDKNQYLYPMEIQEGAVVDGFVAPPIIDTHLERVSHTNTETPIVDQTQWWESFPILTDENLSQLTLIESFHNPTAGDNNTPDKPLFSNDGNLLLVNDKQSAIISFANRNTLQDIIPFSSAEIISPDNHIVAGSSSGDVVRLSDTTTRTDTHDLFTEYDVPGTVGLTFNAQGNEIVTVGSTDLDTTSILFWEVERGRLNQTAQLESAPLATATDVTNQQLAIVTKLDGIVFFDLNQHRETGRWLKYGTNMRLERSTNTAYLAAGQYRIHDLLYTADGHYLIGSASGYVVDEQGNEINMVEQVFVYDVENDVEIPMDLNASQLIVHPTKPWVGLLHQQSITVYDIETHQVIFSFGYQSGTSVMSASFTPNGNNLIIGGSSQPNDVVEVFDATTWQSVARYTVNPAGVFSSNEVAVHPSGRLLIVLTGDEIQIYAVANESAGNTTSPDTTGNVALAVPSSPPEPPGTDGYTWWRVADGSIDDGLWVREDSVTENGACEALPIQS